MSVEFTVKKNDFPKCERIAHDAIEGALELVGAQCAKNAKSLAPVDTGTLRNSIDHQMDGDDTVVVGTNVEYAVYQEFGTSRQPVAANGGKGYMRPAANDYKNQYVGIVERALKNRLG